MKIRANEIAGTIIAVVSTLGIIALALTGQDVPPSLSAISAASATWMFVHSSLQEEHEQADKVREAQFRKE